jgi:hypothetical protein
VQGASDREAQPRVDLEARNADGGGGRQSVSSPSRQTMNSPSAARRPVLRAVLTPPLACRSTRVRGRPSTAAAGSSADPSSTTTASVTTPRCSTALTAAALITSAWL